MEANELVSGERRQSESPARTIESVGSTVASIETIVDRNEELTNVRVDGCTDMTGLNNKHRSLSNSQTSISLKDDRSTGDAHQQQDSLSHIYSSPVYLTTTEKPSTQVVAENETPKLITHAEFEKQQLTPPKVTGAAKSPTATLDSKISKKQRFPPEFIKIKGDSVQDLKVGPRSTALNRITLGVAQLLLSVALVALGALLVVRGASLSAIGSGIWTGGIAAVTGALGVINMRKVQTGFLALSLVCIATSTLALAISGAGLTRDINKLEEKTVPIKLSSERITAAYWLVFTLGLHFAVSVISVYKAASRLCSSSSNDESTHDINNQGLPVDHETVDEYIKTMSVSSGGNNLMKKDHLVPQLMYPSPKNGTIKDSQAHRSIILIPASLGSALLPSVQQTLSPMMRPHPLGVLPPYPMLLPPPGMGLPPVPMVYRGGMTLPSKRPGRHSYGSQRSQMASVRNHRHHQHPHQYAQPPACFPEINGRHTKSHCRTCTNDSSAATATAAAAAVRQQRRKSDTDADNRKAFTYTGLDRQIADSFLARQEQTNGSHIDYTSSSESGRNECRDVAM